jgi:hypothetical protein
MLRALVAALVLANVLFFAWARGWLEPVWPAPHSGEREPARLAAQLHPERVVVLPASAASVAITAAREAALACLEAGPIGEADIAVAESALAAAHLADGQWLREAAPLPPLWLVYAARSADASLTQARAQLLERLKISVTPLEAPPELAGGLLLSRHATREAAEAALATVAAGIAATETRPLRYLRVASLPAPPAQFWLRVPRAGSVQQDQLKALPPALLAGGFKACRPPGA